MAKNIFFKKKEEANIDIIYLFIPMVGWEKDPGFMLGMPHFLPQRGGWVRTGWRVVLQGCLCRRLGSTNLYCVIFICTATTIEFIFHTKLTEH